MEKNADKDIACKFCNKNFKCEKYLERHWKKHNTKCDKCEINFETLHEKKQHEKLIHPQLKIRKCKLCPDARFAKEDQYLEHLELVHKEMKTHHVYMCSDCGKQFKTKCELTHHINSKCGTVKQFTCKECGQELMTAGSLHNHMLRHKGQRSFMCRFCAKLFLTGGQLKVHERIHTKEKAFICEVCGKGFCHRQSLITHSTLHTGIKPFQCENCGNSFSCVGNLIKHRKTHADTCGLIPLTTHRVLNPSTKIKVKINTPETSKLKALEKNKQLQKKLELLTSDFSNKDVAENKSELENMQEINVKTDDSVQTQFTNKNCDEMDLQLEEKAAELSYLAPQPCYIENNACLTNIDNRDKTDFIINEVPGAKNLVELDLASELEERNLEYDEHEDTDEESYDEDNEGVELDTDDEETDFKDHVEEFNENVEDEQHVERKLDRLAQNDQKLSDFIKERKLEGNKKVGCKYCNRKYVQLRCLYKHEQDHLRNDIQPEDDDDTIKNLAFKCSCCKKCFETKSECREHQQSEHGDILTCHECDKIFANLDSLRCHRHVFHKGVPKKEYIYICERCGKKFKQKSMLVIHNNRNCENGPFFECSICKKEFSSDHTRKTHMRIHNSEKNLLCKFCGKSFHWKGQLKVHERSHTGEKPYTCLFCPRTFAYRDSLITHSSMHTGFKPHFCKGCGWRFSCMGNLVKHRISHASTCGVWYQENIHGDNE